MMTRAEIHEDMRQTLGIVPTFMATIPDEFLEAEWDIVKRLEFSETHIPGKYKELIGLGIATVNRCTFCTLFHTEAARLHGATDGEIEEAVHYAKNCDGWSDYIHGMQVDIDQFRGEVRQMVDFLTSKGQRMAA